MANPVKGGKTNYFQISDIGLSAPRNPRLEVSSEGGPAVTLFWDTAIAGDEPISHYEIQRDENVIAQLPFVPQTTMEPFSFRDSSRSGVNSRYRVVTVDTVGRRAGSIDLMAG